MSNKASRPRQAPFTSTVSDAAFTSTATTENCGNCKYWQAADEEKTIGHCRLYPGNVVEKATNYGPRMALPVKNAADWCGQHQR